MDFAKRVAQGFERFHACEPRARGNSRIVEPHADAVPLLLAGIARREEKNVGRALPAFRGGIRGQFDERGVLFIVAAEVIEIRLLIEHVFGSGFLLAGITEDHDWIRQLGHESRAALGVNGIRLALARHENGRERNDRESTGGE